MHCWASFPSLFCFPHPASGNLTQDNLHTSTVVPWEVKATMAIAEAIPYSAPPSTSPPNGLIIRQRAGEQLQEEASKANKYMMLRSTVVRKQCQNTEKWVQTHSPMDLLCDPGWDSLWQKSSHLARQDQVCVELLFLPKKAYHGLAFVCSCLFELKLCSIVVYGVSGEEWTCQCN